MTSYIQMKSHQLPPFIKLKNADGTEDIHYSVFYKGLTNECKRIAQIELNETEDMKRKGMQRLQEMLKGEGISGIDDFVLISVLRKCKYDFKKSEEQLKRFLKTRKMILDKLQKADMKKLEHVLDHMVVGLLPYRDKRGRAIFFTTPNANLELFGMDDMLICFAVLVYFLTTFPMTTVHGVNCIMEGKTPTADIFFPLGKLFVQYVGDIIHFYGRDVLNLRKNYHPDLLPNEFGGTMGPLSNKFYKEELLNFIKKHISSKGLEIR